MDYTIREGNYEKLGVQKKDDAVIFTFEGEKEENCSGSINWKYGFNFFEILRPSPEFASSIYLSNPQPHFVTLNSR